MVQVPMPATIYKAAKEHAASLGMPLATWIRLIVKAESQVPTIDAWAADTPPTAGEVRTWEDSPAGHYRLDVIGRPMYGHMSVRIRQNRGGGRGFTEPLSVNGLDAEPTVFGHREADRRVVYVRGGSFWSVENRMQYPGGALVTLKLLGPSHPAST
jgi:hypothetical protein